MSISSIWVKSVFKIIFEIRSSFCQFFQFLVYLIFSLFSLVYAVCIELDQFMNIPTEQLALSRQDYILVHLSLLLHEILNQPLFPFEEEPKQLPMILD